MNKNLLIFLSIFTVSLFMLSTFTQNTIVSLDEVDYKTETTETIINNLGLNGIPNTPTIDSAVGNNARVLFTWTVDPEVQFITIYNSTPTGDPVHLNTISINTATFPAGYSLQYIYDASNNLVSLINGQTYHFYMTATNGSGTSGKSNVVSAMPVAGPSTPTNAYITSGNNSVRLNWQASTDNGGIPIVQYEVHRATSFDGVYTSIANVSGSTYVYNDTTANNGVTYWYKLRANNSYGVSGYVTLSATPTTTPSIVKNVMSEVGVGWVNISWEVPDNDGGDPISDYTIYRSFDTNFLSPGWITANKYYNDTTVVTNATYFYKVVANNAKGESIDATILTVKLPGAPNIPLNLVATNGGTNITLGWDVPTSDNLREILYYNVYRVENLAFPPITPIGTNTSTQGFVDFSVALDSTYYYFVSAVNEIGESWLTDGVSITITLIVNNTPTNSDSTSTTTNTDSTNTITSSVSTNTDSTNSDSTNSDSTSSSIADNSNGEENTSAEAASFNLFLGLISLISMNLLRNKIKQKNLS